MDAVEPLRRRGLLTKDDPLESDGAEGDSPEGIASRIRILRPGLKRRVTASVARRRPSVLPKRRTPRPEASPGILKSASATDSRPPARTRR